MRGLTAVSSGHEITWSRSRGSSPSTPDLVIAQRVRFSKLAYLSSTFAPAFSSVALTFSASSLVTPSLTGFGRALDQVLGLLEAEAGERAHFLDHLDLLVADARRERR